LCAHTDATGWHGVEGAAHCHDGGCHLTWRGRRSCHCPLCHHQFGSISASDFHDGPNGCLNPAEVPALMWSERFQAWVRRPSADLQRLIRARAEGRQPIQIEVPATGRPVVVENAVVVVPV
jgi:hypothetical protein